MSCTGPEYPTGCQTRQRFLSGHTTPRLLSHSGSMFFLGGVGGAPRDMTARKCRMYIFTVLCIYKYSIYIIISSAFACLMKTVTFTASSSCWQEQWCHHLYREHRRNQRWVPGAAVQGAMKYLVPVLLYIPSDQERCWRREKSDICKISWHISVCCESWPSWMLPSHVSFRACMVRRDPQSDLKSICDLLGMTPCTLKCSLQYNQMMYNHMQPHLQTFAKICNHWHSRARSAGSCVETSRRWLMVPGERQRWHGITPEYWIEARVLRTP